MTVAVRIELGQIVQGTLLALYDFDRYKSSQDDDEDKPSDGIKSLEVVGGNDEEASTARTAALKVARSCSLSLSRYARRSEPRCGTALWRAAAA